MHFINKAGWLEIVTCEKRFGWLLDSRKGSPGRPIVGQDFPVSLNPTLNARYGRSNLKSFENFSHIVTLSILNNVCPKEYQGDKC